MPITVLELAKFRGAKEEDGGVSFQEIERVGLIPWGGCTCTETIACYNAYPSKTGYLKCRECIGDDGYETVEEANKAIFETPKEEELPDDYEKCGECGFDHAYEHAEAERSHKKEIADK